MINIVPSETVARATTLPESVDGDERLVGAAVMGLPFSSGHYLALRDWSATSFADPYRAVFHRDPSGRWTIWSSVPPQNGCGRFWSAGVDEIVVVHIGVAWTDEYTLRVGIPEVGFEWSFCMGDSARARLLSAAASRMPDWAWTNDAVLAAMGRMVGPVLGIGKVRLAGDLPNGQHFRMAPKTMWMIEETTASLNGEDLGDPDPLDRQERLADVWLPQRGVFAVGTVRADAYDPAVHHSASMTRSRVEAN